MGKRAKKYRASRAGGGASSSSTGNRNGEASTSGQSGDQSGGQSGVRVGSLDTNVEQVENQKQEGGETEWFSAQREMRGANVEKLMSEVDLKNRAFETDLAEHKEELSHLKRHMQAMKYEGFKRDLDFSELKEEVVGLTSEVSALKGEASKLKGEVEMLKSQVAIHPKNSVHPVQELGIEQIGKQKADFESLKAGDDAPKSLQNDLLIVGPGALGRIVADKWRMVCTCYFLAFGITNFFGFLMLVTYTILLHLEQLSSTSRCFVYCFLFVIIVIIYTLSEQG